VGKALALGGDDPPILVTTIPNAAGLVGQLGEAASIYYCVDEFSEWPGADRKTMLEMEADLLQRVDLVAATSDTLFEGKSAVHPRVRLLRHGVDWERFQRGAGTVPVALEALPRPRFGFTGLVDERIDTELVGRLAAARPDASFVFVGPRQLGPGPLDTAPNVHFLPAVPYDDVPAVVAAFDVAALPYVESRLTESINPLKLREFLASGVPVVATPLPEVRRYGEFVEAPRDFDGWKVALDRALAEGRSRAAARSASVRAEGWDQRAEKFSRLCEEACATARAARSRSSRSRRSTRTDRSRSTRSSWSSGSSRCGSAFRWSSCVRSRGSPAAGFSRATGTGRSSRGTRRGTAWRCTTRGSCRFRSSSSHSTGSSCS
jgi:hypothetical protein